MNDPMQKVLIPHSPLGVSRNPAINTNDGESLEDAMRAGLEIEQPITQLMRLCQTFDFKTIPGQSQA